MKKQIFKIIITALSLFNPVIIFASVTLPEGLKPNNIVDPKTGYDINGINFFIQLIINSLLGLVGAIAIFFMVRNAYTLMMAGAEESSYEKAKNGFVWAILGLIITIFSYFIVQAVTQIVYRAGS